jgi:hypothetical protein
MNQPFKEWLENLPLQTLTDELKREIQYQHDEHCEKAYTEEDVKLILYVFMNAFDKPCYTTQLSYNKKLEEVKTKEVLFPFKSFYEQHLKNHKDEDNKSNSFPGK